MKQLMTIVCAALWCFGTAPSASAQAPRKVKMTIPVVAHTMTPVYIAQSKGFFAEEKLELDSPPREAADPTFGRSSLATSNSVLLPATT